MASLIYDTGFISFKVQLPNLFDADDMFSLATHSAVFKFGGLLRLLNINRIK